MKILLSLSLSIVAFLSQAQNTPGLLSYYPFHGNANDQSANNYNWTISGPSLSPDRFGRANAAYQFDGANDFMSIPNDSALKPDFPFSISIWFKVNDFGTLSSFLYVSDELAAAYSGFWLGYLADGTVTAGYGNGQGFQSPHRVTRFSNAKIDTSWQHVVAVFNGLNDIDLYLDCALAPGYYSGGASSMNRGNGNTTLGRNIGHSNNSHHDGIIDDVAFFNRALTAQEVDSICNAPASGLSSKNLKAVSIAIYPNPSSDYLNIGFQEIGVINSLLQVRDLSGKLILEQELESMQEQINISAWPKGLYHLNIIEPQNGASLESGKILKQ